MLLPVHTILVFHSMVKSNDIECHEEYCVTKLYSRRNDLISLTVYDRYLLSKLWIDDAYQFVIVCV